MTLNAKCLCGKIAITIDPAPRAEVGVCHCLLCRRWSGSAFFGLTVPTGHVKVEGEPATYSFRPGNDRAYCKDCGTHLWFRDEKEEYEMAAGLFADAARYPLTREMYVDRAMEACQLPGQHHRMTADEYQADRKSREGDDE